MTVVAWRGGGNRRCSTAPAYPILRGGGLLHHVRLVGGAGVQKELPQSLGRDTLWGAGSFPFSVSRARVTVCVWKCLKSKKCIQIVWCVPDYLPGAEWLKVPPQ